jgi:hypothetical protein
MFKLNKFNKNTAKDSSPSYSTARRSGSEVTFFKATMTGFCKHYTIIECLQKSQYMEGSYAMEWQYVSLTNRPKI